MWATFFVLVGSLVYAGRQVREAQRLRQEQTRPLVVVDFQPKEILLYLVIENFGPTLARNVRIRFDPPLTSTMPEPPDYRSVVEHGIATLVPRTRLRYLVDQYNSRADRALPMRYQVAVTYDDPRVSESYEDKYALDLAHLEGSAMSEPTLADLIETVGEIGDRLRDIGRTLSPDSR